MSKRLYRSRKDKMIGGVCGGLAEYFDIDPVIVRAFFIVATFAWGSSLIGYIVLWIIVPFSPVDFRDTTKHETENEIELENEDDNLYREKKKQKKRAIFGIAVIFFGILLLVDNLFWIVDFKFVLSFAMIGLGLYILLKTR